ncbi:MAG: sulfatase, partial [Candidatus Aminicenantes bacterium]|nr:sulfatase [Candidatus Aminicenantes bacterium]
RLIDHLETVAFQTAPLDGVLDASGQAAAKALTDLPQDSELAAYIKDNLNWDDIPGSPPHPLKLKAGKRSGLGQLRGLRTHNVIFAPTPTSFSVSRTLSKSPVLRFGYGAVDKDPEAVDGGLAFEVSVEDLEGGRRESVFRTVVNPKAKKKDRTWSFKDVDLGAYAKRTVRIVFATSSAHPRQSRHLAAWVNPLLLDSERPSPKTNVILISIDTLRADHLGCYGYTRETSPHIDAWAAGGTRFSQVIAQAPYTVSSHMSTLTGLYPSFHKVNEIRTSVMNPKIKTLAEILYAAGYRTWGITGGGQVSSNYGFSEGFESYIEYTANRRDVEMRVAETIAFIEKEKNNPFFIFFHTYKPHAPYRPAPPYDTMFNPGYRGKVNGSIAQIEDINAGRLQVSQEDLDHLVALYDGDIREMDDQLAKLFDYLKTEKLDERTLVVFASDHGEEFGEHGKYGVHSHSLFEELVRVPLVMVLPGRIPAGRVCESQVQLVDIMPTILDIAGAKDKNLAASLAGESLLPLMRKGRSAGPERKAFSERLAIDHIHLRALRTPESKYIFQDDKAKAIVTHRYFDLIQDPREQTSIEPSPAALRELFQQVLFLIEEAKRVDASPREKAIDEETLDALKALGYIR